MPKPDPEFTDEQRKKISKGMIQLIAAQKILSNWKKRVPAAYKEIDKLIKGYSKLEGGDMTLADFKKLSTVNIRVVFNELASVEEYKKDYEKSPLS